MNKYVFFDLDSTLVRVEGLDEMARWKGVHDEVVELTRLSMEGKVPLEEVFPRKIDILAPHLVDLAQLGKLYLDNLTPGLPELVSELKREGWQVGIITGNFEPAAREVAFSLQIDPKLVYANHVELTPDGAYKRFDGCQLLAQEFGKRDLLQGFRAEQCPTQLAFVGDSFSDMHTAEVADFIGFGGVVVRDKVRENAASFAHTATEVGTILLSSSPQL